MKELPGEKDWPKVFGRDAFYQKIDLSKQPGNDECYHVWEYVGSRQAQCRHCGWGIFLDSADEVKDGKILRHGRIVEI